MSQHIDLRPNSIYGDVKYMGSFTTKSALDAALNTQLNTMQNFQAAFIRFEITTAFHPFRTNHYYGYMCRSGSAENAVISVTNVSSAIYAVDGTKVSGSWNYYSDHYVPGLTYTIYADAYGFISSSSKTMFLNVPLPNRIFRAPTNISSLKLVVRGCEGAGYVDKFSSPAPELIGASGFTVACAMRTERLIRLQIDKTTALTINNVANTTAMNNSPIHAQVDISFTA